jgi:DNA-binding transcriptional LysR family regulator
VELIEHKRRIFELTDTGQRLFNSADQIFSAVESVKSTISNSKEGPQRGICRIGIARVLSTYRFDDCLEKLSRENPDLQFKISLNHSEQILDLLLERGLDAALIISDEYRQGLFSEVLQSGSFVLVRPREYGHGVVKYAVSERRHEVDAAHWRYKEKYGQDLPVFAEIPSWDSIWNWVQRGHCGGLIPDLFLHRSVFRKQQLTKVLADVHPYSIRLYFNRSSHGSPVIRLLSKVLNSAFKG